MHKPYARRCRRDRKVNGINGGAGIRGFVIASGGGCGRGKAPRLAEDRGQPRGSAGAPDGGRRRCSVATSIGFRHSPVPAKGRPKAPCSIDDGGADHSASKPTGSAISSTASAAAASSRRSAMILRVALGGDALDRVGGAAGAGRDQPADDDVLLQARPACRACPGSPPRSAPASSPGRRRRR